MVAEKFSTSDSRIPVCHVGLMMKNKWYSGGLHFECVGCGNCCAGPEEGDIWISAAEIELLAKHLGMPETEVCKRFIKRAGFGAGIMEDNRTHDCVFLQTGPDGKRGCAIYPVRPNQCRTWPFWNRNLNSPRDWDRVVQRCPGIDHGPEWSFERIEKLRTQKK
jgi:hypothetical protein